MLKLYYAPRTRASRPRWMLEELGVPFELTRLDMEAKAHKNPDYLRIHPHGSIPALEDDGRAVFESGAICAYLADKYLDKGFAPAVDSPDRGTYYQWLIYSQATLEPPVVTIWAHTRRLPVEKRSASLVEESRAKFAVCARVLSDTLSDRSYLLGEHFTAADVMVGSVLDFAGALGLVSDYPILVDYLEELKERPAYHRSRLD